MSDINKLSNDLFKRVDKYADDIINGNIVACKKHIWSCKRFKNDFNNPNYYFDKVELLKFYLWSRQFKHRAGVLKNQIIELTDFQLFVLSNILCWKRKDNGYRRYRKVYIQLARKNAKSQIMGILASYECFLSDEQAETYIFGWSKEQSSIVYREIEHQLKGCNRLEGKYKNSYGKITNIKDGSFIKPLSREARNTGDGTNPSLGISDEFHSHPTSEIYDVVLSGMVARPQPLMVIITTAGFNLSYPCYKEYEYVSKILDPNVDVENEEYFAIICELDKEDNIKDESVWIKANPIVATYEEGMNYLRGELKSALDAPEKLRNFLTKNMNKWVDMREGGYMDMAKWKNAYKDFNFKDFEGKNCIVGIDLATKLDLTSIGFEFIKDGQYYVLSHSFMPKDTFDKRVREARLPFDLWEKEGYLTITDGMVVDYNYIKKYIQDIEDKYNINITEICYDPWNASQFANDMSELGYEMIEIRQGIRTLGEPCKSFREEAYSGNLFHNNNPVLNWACSNAITKQDSNANFMLDKAQSSDKIDPLASLINAHVIAIQEPLDINEITSEMLDMLGW